MDASNFKVGSSLKINIWIDDEIYPFMLKVTGIENKNTKFEKFLVSKLFLM
jgi:hypothetical protein